MKLFTDLYVSLKYQYCIQLSGASQTVKMSDKKVFPLFKITFFIFCFSVVLYLTSKEIIRYRENEDTSSISFRKFNASPRDKYPVITFCFYGRLGRYSTIYKEDIIKKNGLSVCLLYTSDAADE